jgi:hypothetical protein
MQKWPSSTLCPPNSMVMGTTHFYPVAIRSALVIYAQALNALVTRGFSIHDELEHVQQGFGFRD